MKKDQLGLFSITKTLIICTLGSFIFFQSCQKEKKISTAFYHWKTVYQPSAFELAVLDSLEVERVYAKFFDVDWVDGASAAEPSALIQAKPQSTSQTIIPTIFITNRTFTKTNQKDIPKLAAKIHSLILKLSSQFKNIASETQFDCDWTQSTKEKYFEFLKAYRKLSTGSLSATIRLHQIKFTKQTGIPPVDNGVLMFYNMGEVNKLATKNSIIDLDIANQYLDKLPDYKLPLSIAVPIYRWGVVFRGARFVQLINEIGPEALGDSTLVAPLKANQYRILQNTYIAGNYFYENDIIRLEDSPKKIVKQSVDLLTSKINQDKIEVIYYHLDSMNLQRHFNNEYGFQE